MPFQTAQEDLQEVNLYDLKVYKAANEMVNAMSAELKRIGVPFFGVQHSLIRRDTEMAQPRGDDGRGRNVMMAGEGIDLKQLTTLQARMLELLEDMCKD